MFELDLIKKINNHNKVAIFGTDSLAGNINQIINETYGVDKIEYYIDSNREERDFYGKPVFRLNELTDETIQDKYFIVASYTKSEKMKKLLIDYGVNEEKIIALRGYFDAEILLYTDAIVEKILIWAIGCEKQKILEAKDKLLWYLPQKYNTLKETCWITKENQVLELKEKFDVVFVYRESELQKCENLGNEIYCLDDNCVEDISSRMIRSLSYRVLSTEIKQDYAEASRDNYKKLKEMSKFKKAVLAVGTGPSIEEGMGKIEREGINNFIKIVCNRTVTNQSIMNRIQPEIYTMVSVFTLQQEYEESLKEIVNYIRFSQCVLVVPDYYLPALLRYGVSKDKVILMNIMGKESVIFPDENNLQVSRSKAGIMASVILPLASTLSNKVYLIGCDGKKMNYKEVGLVKTFEESKMFNCNWSGTLHYVDAKNIIRLMEEHKEVFEHGETKGIIYRSLTHSNNRYIEERFYTGKI